MNLLILIISIQFKFMIDQSDPLQSKTLKQTTKPNKIKSNPQGYLTLSLILIGILLIYSIQALFGYHNRASTQLFPTFNLQQSCQVRVAQFHHVIHIPLQIYAAIYFEATPGGGLYLPACDQIKKYDINQWNRQTTIINWAKKNVYSGAIVIYDRPDKINYLELLVLSILVGPFGKIFTTNQFNWLCYDEIKYLYKNFKNVVYTETYPGLYEKYKIIISSNQNMIYQYIRQNHWKSKYSSPQKMIFSIKKQNLLKYQQLFKELISNEQLILSNVWINAQNFDNVLHIQRIKAFQYIQNFDKPIIYFEGKNEKYPKKFDSQLIKNIWSAEKISRSNIIQIQQKYPTNMTKIEKIKDISKFNGIYKQNESKQYEKQIIQWVKTRTQTYYNIYFDNSQVNISVVERLAPLIPQGKLYVNCSEENQKIIIKYTEQNMIRNIIFIKQNCPECQNSHILITNNIKSLQRISANNKTTHQYILWQISEKINENLDVFYLLYTKFHLRKVQMLTNNKNENEQVLLKFKNVLFCIDEPLGLFQIQNEKYVIYVFWNDSLSSLKQQQNIYQNLVQMIKVNVPEVKLILPNIFHYFEIPDAPFHKGFYHLSQPYRSDYIHGYLMNYYGGGYANIRAIQFDWQKYFIKLQNSPNNIYGIGYFGGALEGVSCKNEKGQKSCSVRESKDKQLLIGKGQHIFKKGNILMQKWMNNMNQILQRNYQSLKLLMKQSNTNLSEAEASKLNHLLKQSQFDWSYFQVIENENSGHINKNFPPLILVE